MVKNVNKIKGYDVDDLGIKEVKADDSPKITSRTMSKRYSVYGGYSIIQTDKTSVIRTDEQKSYVVVNGVVYMVENVF